MGLKIIDVAGFQGEKTISNSYFESYLDTSDEWIRQRTGIQTRKFTDLSMEEIVDDLVKNINISKDKKKKIKLVITGTLSSDILMPTLSAIVHEKLNLDREVMSFDMNMACSSFVASIILAEKFLEPGQLALCIGIEKLSKVTDLNDRSTAILFGDGGGICLVEKTEDFQPSIYGTIKSNDLYLKANEKMKMNGRQVFKFATSIIYPEIKKLLDLSKRSFDSIDHVVLHQANLRIIDYIKKKTGHEDKYFTNIEEFGNTSSASIPLSLYQMKEECLLKNGQSILIFGFGGGLTYCSTIVKWGLNEN